MNYSHYQVTHGIPFEICGAFIAKQAASHAILESVAKKHGAIVGRYLRCGSKVEGLALAGRPVRAEGWKASRRHPGYYTPGKSKLGKSIKAELDAIEIPTTEQLAIDLGCEPFFRDFDDGGMYCANIAVFQYAGTFYLQSCKWCRPKMGANAGYGIVPIEASTWHKADEDRLRLERGPAPNTRDQQRDSTPTVDRPPHTRPANDPASDTGAAGLGSSGVVGCEPENGEKP